MYDYSNTPKQNAPTAREIKKLSAAAGLSRTSFALAVMSVFLSQTVFLPLIFSGCSIMLALLSVRGNERPKGRTMITLIIAFGVILIVAYLLYTTITGVIIPFFTDPAYREELNEMYMQMYGISLDDILAPMTEQFEGQ